MALHTMHAGCSRSQGGAYPPFQHKSNVYPLASPQGNNVTPAPVGHPRLSDDGGMQVNSVESQRHGGFKAATASAPRQQDNVPPQQNFNGTHHQQTLQARRGSPGYQHLHHPAAQLGCFQTSTGQQKAYSKPHNNTDLQQRQHSSCAFSTGTNSSALNGGGLGVSAQGGQYSLADKVLRKSPIVYALLTQHTPSSSVEQTNANVKTQPPTDDQIQEFITKKLNYLKTQRSDNADHLHRSTTSASDKDERHAAVHCAEQRSAVMGRALQKNSSEGSEADVKSKDSGDCPTVTSDKCSTGTMLAAIADSAQMHLHQPLSLDNDASEDFYYAGKMHLDVIMPTSGDCKLVHSYYTEDRKLAGSNDESFRGQLSDKHSQNGEANLHYSLSALKELVASLEKVETIAKGDNISNLILKQYWNGDIGNLRVFTSTEYPNIMAKVAATCTKNEDGSSLVVPVSRVTLNALTEKEPSLMLHCSSSKGEESSHWWNNNNSSGEMDREAQMAVNRTTEKEKGDADRKLVEAAELVNVQGATVSEYLQTKSSSVVTADKKTLALTSLNCENEDTNKNRKRDTEDQHYHALHEDVMKAGSGSQTDSRQTLPKKTPNPPRSPEIRQEEASICKDPQYEDVSDEEIQLLTTLPNTEYRKSNVTPCLDEPQYEDLSDDGQQIEATPSFTQAGESNTKQSPLRNDVHRQAQINPDEKLITKEQISPKMGTPDVAQHCACESGDRPCPKCDQDRHLGLGTKQPASCNTSPIWIVDTDDDMEEDDDDDDDDDDCIVIHISLTDIKFEPEDKAHDVEVVVLGNNHSRDEGRHSDTCSDLYRPLPNPKPAAAFPTLEVFDTPLCFMRAKTMQTDQSLVLGSNRTTSDEEEQSNGEHQTRRQSSPEPEDSCETEDSNDYSSGSEHNYLTVPKHMFQKCSKPLPSYTDDSESHQESNNDEARNVEQGEARTTDTFHKLARSNHQTVCSDNDVIIIDSDTDDEKETACRKDRVPTTSPSSQQHRPERPKAPSKAVEHETSKKKPSKKEISHSYSKDDRKATSKRKTGHGSSKVGNDHNGTSKKKSATMVSPVSKDDGSAPNSVHKRPTSESTNSQSGPVKKKQKENESSSYDSSKKQPRSVDRVADSISSPHPGVDKSSSSSKHLRLSKDSDHRRQTSKPLPATRKRSDSCDNSTQHSHRDEREKVVSKPKPADDRHCTANKLQTKTKPTLFSRQLSSPYPSTSSSSSTTTGGQRPEARRSSELSWSRERTASPSPPKTAHPSRRHSSPTRRNHSDSFCTPSTPDHRSATKRPSPNEPAQSSWEKMRKDWSDTYFPTRRDKRSSSGTEKPPRTTCSESRKEVRPRHRHKEKPRRQRHSSNEPATPLMKRTMMEARELTKARNRDIIRGPRPFE